MIQKLKGFLNKAWVKKVTLILFYMAWIGSIMLKCFYVQLTLKINQLSGTEDMNMFVGLFLTVFIFFGVIILFSGKKSKAVLIILDGIITFILFADILYGRYYYNPITVPILRQIGFVDDVKNSMLALVRIKDLLMFTDFIVLGTMAFYLRKAKSKISFPIQMLVGLAIILVGVGGFHLKINTIDTSKYVYERKYIARDLGLIYYHYYDIHASIEKAVLAKTPLTDEQIGIIESANKAYQHTNEFSNIGKGKNLIIIQLEAFMNFPIDLKVDGQEVTPFLNSLKTESTYMPNYFIETAGGNTVDSELLANTSTHPTYAGSAYYEYPSNYYISLPNKLKEMGYHANSFHGYQASFWNREVMHKNLGFDHFYSLDEFDQTEKVGWAVSDVSFLKQSLDKTIAVSKGEPFYSFMITLSSHYPYDAFYSGPFTKDSNEILKRYFNAANYVDTAMKGFFDDLKAKGLYDNTIVAIYGDHAGLFNEEAAAACNYFGEEYSPYNWQKLEKIPLFIHIPGREGQVVDKVCGQIDLFPTLANMMGFDLEYCMGQDIMDPAYKGNMVRRSSNVVTNQFVYIAREEKVYDFKTAEPLDLSLYKDEIGKYYDQLIAQDLIYRSNYLSIYDKE